MPKYMTIEEIEALRGATLSDQERDDLFEREGEPLEDKINDLTYEVDSLNSVLYWIDQDIRNTQKELDALGEKMSKSNSNQLLEAWDALDRRITEMGNFHARTEARLDHPQRMLTNLQAKLDLWMEIEQTWQYPEQSLLFDWPTERAYEDGEIVQQDWLNMTPIERRDHGMSIFLYERGHFWNESSVRRTGGLLRRE